MLVWSGSSSQYLSGSKHPALQLSVLSPWTPGPGSCLLFLAHVLEFLLWFPDWCSAWFSRNCGLSFRPSPSRTEVLILHSAPLGWDSVVCHGIFLTPTTYLLHFLLLGLPEGCHDWINMLTSQISGLRLSLYNILSNGLFCLVPGTPWLLTMARLPSNLIFQPHSACTCPDPDPDP